MIEMVCAASNQSVPLLPSSRIRKMRDLFGIVQSAFREIQKFFMRVEYNPNKMEQLKGKTFLADWNDTKIGPCYGAALALSQGKCLTGSHLKAYSDALKSEKLQFLDSYVGPSCSSFSGGLPELPDFESKKTLLAIPIVVKGRFRDHVVIVVVDREQYSIEFYDSKGLTVNDRASDRLACYPEHTLKSLIEKIWEKYAIEKEWGVKENTTRHQSDGYNCGVYVSNYLKWRVDGELFDPIVANGLTFKQAGSSERSEMVESLIEYGLQL